MCKRLRRMRGRFPLQIHLPRCISSHLSPTQNAKVFDPELSGEPQARAHAVSATTRPQTYPGASPRADLHPDGPAMMAASVESYRFVVLRSPRGRLGWYNTCATAYAAYAAASRVRYISHGPWRYTSISHDLPKIRSRALWRPPSAGACGVGDYPTPDLSRRESGSRSATTKSK